MPLTRLTLEERIRLVRYYSMYEKSSFIQKAWRKEIGTDPPSRKTIAALNKKFDETGSVADLTRSGRPKTSRTEDKVALVQAAIKQDPTRSIRSLSSELGVNKAAIHRIKQESEKHKSTLRHENKKLRDKVTELQRRLDILEGRKASEGTTANTKPAPTPTPGPSYLVDLPEQPIVSSIPTSFQPEKYMVTVKNGRAHAIHLDQHQRQRNQPTVITVMGSLKPEDMHLETHEMVDAESGEVHHITVEVEDDGELEPEMVDHEEEEELVEQELVEDGDHEMLGEDVEEEILDSEVEVLSMNPEAQGITKYEAEDVSDLEICYTIAPTSSE